MTAARESVLAYLARIEREGIRLGIDRVAAISRRMGEPHRGMRVVQVAGTNGKGSVAAMIAAVLDAAGYRTGFYLSPHLREVNERIRVGGGPVVYEALADDLAAVEEAARQEAVVPTYFEALTLAAYRRFSLEKVDCAVVEVGLGGRLDATSIASPSLAVITEIDKDHMEYLGESLDEIAREKAAIAAKGIVTVIGTKKRALARRMAAMVVANGGVPEVVSERCLGRVLSMGLEGQTVELVTPNGAYRDLRMSLVGHHQLDNLLTATRATELLAGVGLPVTEGAYREGVGGVDWPGRFEVRSREPLVILDGAHNPAGVKAVIRTFRTIFGEGRGIVVLAPLVGKNLVGMLSMITPWVRRIIVTRVAGPRGIDPRSVPVGVAGLKGSVETSPTLADAIDAGLRALTPGEPLLVTGSLSGLGEASATLDGILGPKRSGR